MDLSYNICLVKYEWYDPIIVSVTKSTTVKQLKEKISEVRRGIKTCQQRLTFDHDILEDHETMAEKHIGPDSDVFISMKLFSYPCSPLANDTK